jgi:hypothetical protein
VQDPLGPSCASRGRTTQADLENAEHIRKGKLLAMNDEHSRIRTLKQRWDEDDAARDKQEERAQQIFLEKEANQTFAPIEDYLTRLGKVLSAHALWTSHSAYLGGVQCLHLPSAERRPNRNSRRRNATSGIGSGSLLPLKRGFFSPVS